MDRPQDPTVERRDFSELLHHDQYTPQEAAFLLGVDVDVIYQAAHRGNLKAVIAGHDVLYIFRHDLIEWLDSR
jgi:excisionase family DNA binding protein